MPRLAITTWPEVDAVATTTVLAVPIGATEQHGPHLPIGTDTEIAVALAERLAAVEPRVVVAPALAYGASGEHQDFPGTISIGAEATETVLVELCRSTSRSFTTTLLISTHGGNAGPLRAAVARLRAEGRDVRAFTPRWGGDAHAGHSETSLMLALAPTQVRRQLAVAGNVEPLSRLLGQLREAGVRAISESGVLGDPAGASAAKGEAMLSDAVNDLLAFLGAPQT